MIIGEKFAYGHIPKTGGDAVHNWFGLIHGVHIDSVHDPRKHEFFWQRDLDKDVYVLSIRRLPSWAMSYLHELTLHPKAAGEYGLPPDDIVRPENAFALRPDRYLLEHQKGGHTVAEWLRMEYLFHDVAYFINRYIARVTPDLIHRLSSVATKGSRNYDHRVDAFFTSDQIATLYARNPAWAAVEQAAYGDLYAPAVACEAGTSTWRIAA